MRGWSLYKLWNTQNKKILPAYAGVIFLTVKPQYICWNSSRVCGGDPKYIEDAKQRAGFFPRMRGWYSWFRIFDDLLRILPAYAGVILKAIISLLYSRHSSRVCGGDPKTRIEWCDMTWFFPRMRGWWVTEQQPASWYVILPAYAGVILVAILQEKTVLNSSRVCGGDPWAAPKVNLCSTFFPRMRGWS